MPAPVIARPAQYTGHVDPGARFRQLPSVDELARALSNLESRFPRALIVAECRGVLEHARQAVREGAPVPPDLASRAVASLESLVRPSLLRVINATGVILHTNLGRAPLNSAPAAETYSNLEYDLHAGRRGQRDTHTAALLQRLLDAPAIVVNNGAAAVYLALHELAAGGEVVISRGELIEIGDGFRIPDIMAHSGARVVEIGTTNRTHIDDYRERHHPRDAAADARPSLQFPHGRIHRPACARGVVALAASAASRSMRTSAAGAWWI